MGIPVAVMPLAKQDVQEKLTVSGPVSGTDSVDVVSNIHAEITAMNVKEGDTVTKGQVLAVVDSTDLEREVQIAQNAYDLAVANKQERIRKQLLDTKRQSRISRRPAWITAGTASSLPPATFPRWNWKPAPMP